MKRVNLVDRCFRVVLAAALVVGVVMVSDVSPVVAQARPFGQPRADIAERHTRPSAEERAEISGITPQITADDDIPGFPMPASPVAGELDELYDYDDVYSILLEPGDTLSVSLTGAALTDFDLWLFGPDATSVYDIPAARATTASYPEVLEYTVPFGAGGTYYLDIFAHSGSGAYAFTYTVTPGVPPEADDDIPGVSITPSPIIGTLDAGTDDYDVYGIWLSEGDVLSVNLTGDVDTDFDVALFEPWAWSVTEDVPVASSFSETYPDAFHYRAYIDRSGMYFLAVGAFTGSGEYTLTYSVEQQTAIVGPWGWPVAQSDGRTLDETRAASPNGEAGDWFGDAVAVSEDYLVVGMPGGDTPGVWVASRDGAGWGEFQQLPTVLPATGALGSSVAVEGEWVVAGAPDENHVYIWKNTGGVWETAQVLSAVGTRMGTDVAISGDRIVVGDAGWMFVYRLADESWLWEQSVELGGSLGLSVDIDRDEIAVGDPEAGQVTVFWRLGETSWIAEETIAGTGDSAVALEGNVLAIGTGSAGEGVQIWNRTGYGWLPMDLLLPSVATDETYGDFGSSVAISGNRMVIGAPHDDELGVSSGAAYLFYNTQIGWREIARLAPASNQLGYDVGVSGDWIAAGTHGEDLSGAAYAWPVDEPFEAPAGYTLRVGAPGVLRNDLGTEVWAIQASDATYGTVELETDGSFTYTQDVPHLGPDSFTYYLQNVADRETHSVTVEINVVEPVYDPVTLAGATRYSTSVEVSKETFPYGADTVLIATGRNWPDALGGSALAGAVQGPILLSDTTYIPDVVADEIVRLKPTEAIILGGTGVIETSVEDQLESLGVPVITRLAGLTRYETAQRVAEETIARGAWDGTVIVATGTNFADALAGSPIAAYATWPIYLANPNAAPYELVSTLQDIGADYAVVLGGRGAVSDAYFSALDDGLAFGALRRAGDTRYSTAVDIAQFGVNELGMSWDGLGMAVGTNFPDGLSGGVLCGLDGSVMLLTDGVQLSPDTGTALTAHADEILGLYYFGGVGAVTQSVRDQIAAILEK